jgi:hypothetical protein
MLQKHLALPSSKLQGIVKFKDIMSEVKQSNLQQPKDSGRLSGLVWKTTGWILATRGRLGDIGEILTFSPIKRHPIVFLCVFGDILKPRPQSFHLS